MKEETENPILGYMIFILLNIIISVTVLIFIVRITEGASFYEKAYAKRISLLIDDAQANTVLFIDVKKGSELAQKFKKEPEFAIQDNEVLVKLSQGPGHSDTFFRNLDIKLEYLNETQLLKIEINEKIR